MPELLRGVIAFKVANGWITFESLPHLRIAQRRVGKRIRELRTKRNWSQEFLAAESGLNTNYLGGIERAERNPSLKNLARIADALGVTIPDLVETLRD